VANPIELLDYVAPDGDRPYPEWLRSLKDRRAANLVRSRVERTRLGNFGDHRSVGEGVSELRIHFGPGFRVYFLQDGPTVVVLLCGGEKRSQERDIARAKAYAADYWRRK
jgi:putative addiction module killer protein